MGIELIVGLVVGTLGIVVGVLLYYVNAKEWRELLDQRQKKYNDELSFRKSSEVRLGKIGESLAPFLTAWPYDPGNFRFLGNPVDGIQINDDAIILVEIKTGHSRLSKSQQRAKQLVKEGKVYFETFRISENGCELKREDKVKQTI